MKRLRWLLRRARHHADLGIASWYGLYLGWIEGRQRELLRELARPGRLDVDMVEDLISLGAKRVELLERARRRFGQAFVDAWLWG